MVYDKIPIQRCWAHKIRNILNKVRKADQAAVKAGLHAVMNADTAPKAPRPPAASTSAGATPIPPPSIACATISTSSHLLPLQYARTPKGRQNLQRHRTPFPRSPPQNPTYGRLPGQTSMDRILFAVFTHENKT